MKSKLAFFVGLLGSASIGHSTCTVTGYVGNLQYWMKGGWNYGLEASIYDYVGGNNVGLFRIFNVNSASAPQGDLDEKKDTKASKLFLEKSFNEYRKLHGFTISGSSNNFCVSKTGEEYYLRLYSN